MEASSNHAAEVAARVAREKAAHEDGHIDDALRKWWARFPHVFLNPSAARLNEFYSLELGSVRDKRVLEYGCGQGDFATWLLDQGANVVGIDISEFNIAKCGERAAAKFDATRYSFMVMDAHVTPFPDHSFDRILGNGILHHLDLSAAMREVDRLLKPGGKALFHEPLGDNPLMRLYRSVAAIHTVDERPLTLDDLRYLKSRWNIEMKFTGLLTLPFALLTSIVAQPYPNNWVLRAASAFEQRLNDRHLMDHWNRFAVLVYEKAAPANVAQCTG